MEIAAIAGLTVAAAFLAVVLRQHKPEFALAVGLMAGIVILAVCLRKAAPALGSLSDLLNAASLPAEYGAALFKALGVCLLTQLASDACSDAGERRWRLRRSWQASWLCCLSPCRCLKKWRKWRFR